MLVGSADLMWRLRSYQKPKLLVGRFRTMEQPAAVVEVGQYLDRTDLHVHEITTIVIPGRIDIPVLVPEVEG